MTTAVLIAVTAVLVLWLVGALMRAWKLRALTRKTRTGFAGFLAANFLVMPVLWMMGYAVMELAMGYLVGMLDELNLPFPAEIAGIAAALLIAAAVMAAFYLLLSRIPGLSVLLDDYEDVLRNRDRYRPPHAMNLEG